MWDPRTRLLQAEVEFPVRCTLDALASPSRIMSAR